MASEVAVGLTLAARDVRVVVSVSDEVLSALTDGVGDLVDQQQPVLSAGTRRPGQRS